MSTQVNLHDGGIELACVCDYMRYAHPVGFLLFPGMIPA
jgi:hypothetical protein